MRYMYFCEKLNLLPVVNCCLISKVSDFAMKENATGYDCNSK